MTTQLDGLASMPDPAMPFATADRLPQGAKAVARYGDPVWCLHPLIENPGAVRSRIHWANFPDSFREECRYLAYRLINDVLPSLFLADRTAAWRERIGAESCHQSVLHWAEMTTWLHQNRITTLRNLSENNWLEYHQFVLAKGLSRSSVRQRLTSMQRLWIFDHTGTRPLGIAEPPWNREGCDDYLPAASSTAENTTDPISPATMGPLLIWSLRMVEDFADDILNAWAEHTKMVQIPMHVGDNAAARPRLDAYLQILELMSLPIPTVQRAGKTVFAVTYMAGLTGASKSQVQHALDADPYWGKIKNTKPGPCPLPIRITGKIDNKPWTEAIDFAEAPLMMRHLGTAAFIVIAYLTGMRPGEVLGLRAGCCPDPETGRHLIHGHEFKNARDEQGNHLSRGLPRAVPWVAIPPVVTAIRILERIVPSGSLLFDTHAHQFVAHRTSAKGSLTLYALRDRVEDFADWASALAERLDRTHETVPADSAGLIGTARFRRTLAWHIARRPGGLVALAIQYGHMRTAVSAGYASRSRDGIHALLDIETARVTAETLTTLHDDLASGTGVSGPAAHRLIQAAAQAPAFVGAITTSRQAKAILGNPILTVHDNPRAFAMCVYNRDKALCRRVEDDDSPRLDRCFATCANLARTDHHANQLATQVRDLELQAESGSLPPPLADRLRGQATRLREHADHHHNHRITSQEPSA
ncbi:integrase [Streptomyces albidoflavus]|uniref:integrase n=1 Tax=Streptomyces albidoflavus TaxID=1886 RepID=UPI00308752CC|nr:integrase [Streptomyces albidoflavus]WSD52839.1 integrase [Streptomyces albidoflavus]WTC31877.1 integrase [Streptomyces albidoflavus]